MSDLTQAESEVRKLMGQDMAAAVVDHVKIREGSDSDGNASLFVTVTLVEEPPEEEYRKISLVVGQFRSWLSASTEHDERFPYFQFTTLAEERAVAEERNAG